MVVGSFLSAERSELGLTLISQCKSDKQSNHFGAGGGD